MAARPVIAGADGSEESLRAADWAAREAVLRKTARRVGPLRLRPRDLWPWAAASGGRTLKS